MTGIYISAADIEEKKVVKRKPLSISANLETHPEFANNLRFYRDARVMTPVMLFVLDLMIEKGMSTQEIAENYQQIVQEAAQELLKE